MLMQVLKAHKKALGWKGIVSSYSMDKIRLEEGRSGTVEH